MMHPVDKWSKVVLVASTVLVAYALAALAAPHLHHMLHHSGHQQQGMAGQPDHHDHARPPCVLRHFLLLSLFTGLTGMYAAIFAHRRATSIYVVLLLVLQLAALGVLSHGASHAYHHCLLSSEKYQVGTRLVEYSGPGISIVTAERDVRPDGLDVARLNNCNHHVYHVFLIASSVLGVAVLSMMHCALRLHRAVEAEEAAEVVLAVDAGEDAECTKADPLATQAEEGTATTWVLISRH